MPVNSQDFFQIQFLAVVGAEDVVVDSNYGC